MHGESTVSANRLFLDPNDIKALEKRDLDFQTFSKHFLGRIARYQWVKTEKAWNRVFQVASVQLNPVFAAFLRRVRQGCDRKVGMSRYCF
jgi:hypothetical protein